LLGRSALSFLTFGGSTQKAVLQSEPAECALACLATVAAHYGYETDLLTLRARFPLSMKGATLRTLMNIGEALGLASRPLRLEPQHLDHLALPAILHWNMAHFLVLTAVRGTGRKRKYHLADPAMGDWVATHAEMSASFTGVAVEFTPTANFQPGRERARLKLHQLWTRIRHLGRALTQIVALTVIMQFVVLALPFLMQFAVDTALPAGDRGLLLALTWGFLGIAGTGILASVLRGYLATNLGQMLSYQLGINLARHLFKLPLGWFEKRQVGDLLSRLDSTSPIGDFFSRNFVNSLIDGVMAISTLALMFMYSPALSFLALLSLAVYAIVRLSLLPTYNRRNTAALAARAREHGMMIENLSGIGGIKAFGHESDRLGMWIARKAQAVNHGTALARVQTVWDILEPAIRSLDAVVFVFFAVSLAMSGSLTLGMIFAFAAYKQQFFSATFSLVQLIGTYRALDVHLSRIADIALAAPEAVSDGDVIRSREVRGDVEVRNVSFSYGTGEPMVLDDVNLKVTAGETIAIVGRSGGGKTTLLKILLGLLEPTAGTVLIDGIGIDAFGKRTWRSQVGYVAQDDSLYSGSIAQNIAFFDPEMDMARVIAAATQAVIHDDILAMPMSYESLVGDMGSTLSGGQRARVLIARALYRNPRVLLIDEGSAHLDLATERRLNEALAGLGVTRIIVSHRPETIAAAARALLLKDGRIIAMPAQERPAVRAVDA
jgi:ATP-binding cassette subfamily B protein RaxB